MSIRFGTDGWRGIIADDFTFDGVRAVAQALADLIHEEGPSVAPVPVGHDVRFLSRRFAEAVSGVLEGNGLPTILPDSPTTTPMVSCQVAAAGAPLGVCITASHNPPHYNGLKVKAAFGGSAPPELTARLEALIGRRAPRHGRAPERRHPYLPAYVPRLAAVVDLEAVRRAGLRVVVDSMHGAGGRILEGLLRGGRTRVVTIRGDADVLFGGTPPEPRPENLAPLVEAVRGRRAQIGLATDGDADRIGVVDEAGRVVTPFQIYALLALHLLETKKWRGAIVHTFANTLLAERIARRHGLPFHTLPIGFKHIARLMLEQDVLIGGEESGGIGVKRFLPERDGILVGLLLLEMLAAGGRRLSRRIAAMEEEYGRFVYRRVDLALPSESGREMVARLLAHPPARLGGLTVSGIDTLDGVKLLFGDAGWILFRASGTEPLLRVYCEAPTAAQVDRLVRA
ncbi:MAG TPA: phosphoglucomutase/phosphomannomutase family protein, partial [Candidatus Polarisedimenticolia bacterium]|nr:phosphoglucomutase/phosphomannomutase family protein [Candidatus Polarisedimenticolia bacterium]